ncbi:MAG: hypothetical protein IKK58_03300 [Clostridia bacterium]|nr:hypothetical protein [Clostridia bacterium]
MEASGLMLCGVDKLERSFLPCKNVDPTKKVGVFYFLWHGDANDRSMGEIYNITELLREHPDDLWNIEGTPLSPKGKFHYWDQPIFGYYKSVDKWVITRHMELLINAGVDFLYLDATNAFIYPDSCRAIFEVLLEFEKNGKNPPKVMFYTNSNSIRTITAIYNTYYTVPEYDSLWYRPEGKPIIVGNATVETDSAEAALRGDTCSQEELADHIREYFDIRPSQWPFDPVKDDGFPWMEWSYPQPIHNGIVNVSLCQHPHIPLSDSVKDRTRNMGRGYDFALGKNVAEDVARGTNAQSQWDTVHRNRDKVHTVTVTGWNEWIAIKLIMENRVFFVDTMNEEFSRDIEPQKGDGYEDTYYLQLADNIRRFKGEIGLPDPVGQYTPAGMDWEGGVRYDAVTLQQISRDCYGVDNRVRYVLPPARNNLQCVSVANDASRLYFRIQSADVLCSADKEDFLNLYLGNDIPALKGWESYELQVIPSLGKVFAIDGQKRRTEVCDATCLVEGKVALISIPMEALSCDEGIYFKVTDGFDSTDIMDSYTDGKCMPMGRASWYYRLSKDKK